jgi:predicted porin/prefoldin subunit 5
MEEDASMKRLLVTVAGLSLITGLTFAQMRDVPPGHWAYQSIEQLVQLGIIEGYPDGTFRPNRTMTRAEFAQAIARAYRNIDERLRALDRRISEIRPQDSQPVDTSALERQINELRAQIEELKKLNEAIQTLQRLAQTFQQELAGLGVDVDTLKRDFASLRARVEALEGKEEKFKMSGDLTFGVYGAHSIDGKDVYTFNRTRLGSGKFLQEIAVPHELGLTFSGQINDEVTGSATFILGNYLPYVGGSGKSALTTFSGPYAIGNTDIVIWEAFVKAPIDIFGAKVDVTVGRYPAKITPFTLQRIKPDYYLNFPRYGDGAFRVDGGALGFNFDTFRLNLWAAQVNQQSNNGVFNRLLAQNHNSSVVDANGNPVAIDQFAGARLEFDAIRGEDTNLTVGATYYAAGVGRGRNFRFGTLNPQNVNRRPIDRLDVFGADIKAKFAGFNIGVEYAQSDFLRDTNRVLSSDNWALDANLGYNFGPNLGITAGYREVRPYFAAPGAWGRVGYLYNPSDLRGFYVGVNYTASEDLKINITGAFLEGTGRARLGNNIVGYRTNDEVIQVLAGVDYRLSERLNVSLNYEGVFWKLGSVARSPKPVWNYLTLGVGYDLGENTALNVLYQILDTDGKGTPVPFRGGPDTRRNNKNGGAVAATTLSVKF